MSRRYWLLCDRGVCLYENRPCRDGRLLERCVKHGAILCNLGWGVDMTRSQVRAEMRRADERAARERGAL